MSLWHRRNFLKASGLTAFLPILHPVADAAPAVSRPNINFITVGEMVDPQEYAVRLLAVCQQMNIEADRFGDGGCVAALEQQFQAITGKEKAKFMPTGTMANQLAIKLLSGNKDKVFVLEASHTYRDEADAAQILHGKRLVPLGNNEPYFNLAELKEKLRYFKEEESFPAQPGALALEVPVRRCDNRVDSYEQLKKVSDFCRENNIPVHMDGARLYMAAAWSGRSIKEYANLADTLYISLYKYLGASAGAILCGKAALIDQLPVLMKMHGGSMYHNWTNAAMVLNQLEGFEQRLAKAKPKGEALISQLNKLKGIRITPHKNGCSNYKMELSGVATDAFRQRLSDEGIRAGLTSFVINETILYRSNDDLFDSFKRAIG
jgi:threonine aldolase